MDTGQKTGIQYSELLRHILGGVQTNCHKHERLEPALFFIKDGVVSHVIVLSGFGAFSSDEKEAFQANFRRTHSINIGADACVFIMEAWMVLTSPDAELPKERPSEHPDRKSCIFATYEELEMGMRAGNSVLNDETRSFDLEQIIKEIEKGEFVLHEALAGGWL